MPSPIDVVFDADTGRYVANVDAGTSSVEKMGQAVADTKNKILDSLNAQVVKMVEAGASQEELARVTERAAAQMAAVTNENAERIGRNLDRKLEKERLVSDETARLAKTESAAVIGAAKDAADTEARLARETAEAKRIALLQQERDYSEYVSRHKAEQAAEGDHEGLSNKQAASAVLRGGGLRAAENVFAFAPAAALQIGGMAFGVTTLATVLFDMGEKGLEAFEKVRHAAELSHAAFDEAHDKSRILIDDKELENQKIQDQIDKISGHPNNGLATALLEAKKMADQLTESFHSARKELDELFRQNQMGMFGRTLQALGVGPDSTSKQEKNLGYDAQNLQRDVDKIRDEYSSAMSSAKDDNTRKELTKNFSKKVSDRVQFNIGSYDAEIGRLRKEQDQSEREAVENPGAVKIRDTSGKITELEDRNRQLRDMQRSATLDTSIFEGRESLGKAKQDKANSAGGESNKADEKQRKAWQEEDNARKIAGTDSTRTEVGVWASRLDGLKQGSDQYLYAQRELASKMTQQRRESTEADKQEAAAAIRDQRNSWESDHAEWTGAAHRTAADEQGYWLAKIFEAEDGSANYLLAMKKSDDATRRMLAEQEIADRERMKARNKASLAQGQQETAYRESALGIQKMTGQISQQGAAMALAGIHTDQYTQKLAELQRQLAEQTEVNRSENGPNASVNAAMIDSRAAIDKANAERRIQIERDAAEVAATTWQGALKNANASWVQDSTNSAKQVVEFYGQAVNGLNENLESLATGGKSNFGSYFKGLGKTLVGDGLKHVEAPIMNALGMGKADGSESNPFSVKVVGAMGGSMGTSIADIIKGFPGSKSDGDDDSGIGGVASGLISAVPGGGMLSSLFHIFGGHRALGGNVKAGVTYDVGEMGREEFTPDQDGSITPHDKVSNSTSNASVFYNVKVSDGVTPSEMEMKMRAMLTEYHPHGVAASVAAMRNQQSRRPLSSR